MQLVPITTKAVRSNPAHDEVYSIQHFVIKFCQWFAIGRWFSPGTPVSCTNKTDRYHITELLLKVALNTINLSKASFLGPHVSYALCYSRIEQQDAEIYYQKHYLCNLLSY
jgi:hypothetical protein